MSTDFTIHAGIPFSRSIRVVDGKNIWADVDTCEVRCQLRLGNSETTRLVCNLHDYMTVDLDLNDIVITWSMSGAETREIGGGPSSALAASLSGKQLYYEMVLSDAGATDTRAMSLLSGHVTFITAITSAVDSA